MRILADEIVARPIVESLCEQGHDDSVNDRRDPQAPTRQAHMMIRIVLPFHLRTLARIDGEVTLDVAPPATPSAILTALEARYPMLRGTIRDHTTHARRPFVRFFACGKDFSHDPPDAPLPDAVATGEQPFMVVGAIAGG
jgi:hypothetical protein